MLPSGQRRLRWSPPIRRWCLAYCPIAWELQATVASWGWRLERGSWDKRSRERLTVTGVVHRHQLCPGDCISESLECNTAQAERRTTGQPLNEGSLAPCLCMRDPLWTSLWPALCGTLIAQCDLGDWAVIKGCPCSPNPVLTLSLN